MSVERPAFAWLNDAGNYAREARQIAISVPAGTLSSRDYQAIRYCLMVVGDVLYWVSADLLAGEPSIPWRRIIALRHRLVHGYWLIDEDIISEIARNETAELIAALERLIEKIE